MTITAYEAQQNAPRPASPPTSLSYSQHDQFWSSNGDTVLRVEQTYFKIHRNKFIVFHRLRRHAGTAAATSRGTERRRVSARYLLVGFCGRLDGWMYDRSFGIIASSRFEYPQNTRFLISAHGPSSS